MYCKQEYKVCIKGIMLKCSMLNSLSSHKYGDSFKSAISVHVLWIKFMSTYCEITLRWMSQNTYNDKSTYSQELAWGHRMTCMVIDVSWMCFIISINSLYFQLFEYSYWFCRWELMQTGNCQGRKSITLKSIPTFVSEHVVKIIPSLYHTVDNPLPDISCIQQILVYNIYLMMFGTLCDLFSPQIFSCIDWLQCPSSSAGYFSGWIQCPPITKLEMKNNRAMIYRYRLIKACILPSKRYTTDLNSPLLPKAIEDPRRNQYYRDNTRTAKVYMPSVICCSDICVS